MNTYVVLWASDGRAAPLNGVTTPDEAAQGVGLRRPGHGELDGRGVGGWRHRGVQGLAAGDELLELAVHDLELRSVGRISKDRIAGGT